ncbi:MULTISPECIES: MCE family protein [Mycobacteriaceae]|uniref:MCE family protein n=1 Tax=Mycobacteriaceae TaxID=1762 RepID=UPI001060EF34|nr:MULTISPECIES: MlaD family protein [Mycobacteriaceae]MBB3630126.1 phospholipid/cholesterol/gamma-HCH transport system substrate-binding protein [Mycolicibacterium sp. BK607]MBB3748124.1 phospholipid/cholesterol/gamma-HCH transport system substrate-binding protein [Mycolicibacterium sp. BK634]TDO09941.1 phospholipid/cholesterol/gamma-HCH transport system substrate-binding protein [Mycobacterium sp. BK086]
MHVSRRILIQLAIFAVISLIAGAVMIFGYIKIPAMAGLGRYTVTIELPQSGGLYPTGNVTYRGTQVGKVTSVHLNGNGSVAADLALDTTFRIPSNVDAQVHSQSAVGEQYVALVPQDDTSPPLKNGDVIPLSRTSVPPPIDGLLDAANRGLQAIPHDNLKTAVDESYAAVGNLGPELARIVKGSTTLSSDARANLMSITTLIDQSGPLLRSQVDTGSAIQAWARHLATITGELRDHDTAVAGIVDNGGPGAEEARQLIEELKPTLPVLLSNLVSVGQVAVTYRNDIEQLLVLVPQGIAMAQGGVVANHGTKQDYVGSYLDFNLNMNLPAPCTTGFLPPSQRRTAVETDAPDRPQGDLYCRIPQDAQSNVRGARNIPCETRPGKRAPTVAMCESDEQYIPLNDGNNWKGDPNATLSGQDIPQLPPASAARQPGPADAAPEAATPPPSPALAIAQYDAASGTYIGPDGQVVTQADIGQEAPKEKKWQTMLMPPASN